MLLFPAPLSGFAELEEEEEEEEDWCSIRPCIPPITTSDCCCCCWSSDDDDDRRLVRLCVVDAGASDRQTARRAKESEKGGREAV